MWRNRNYDGVRFDELRRLMDDRFHGLHDELEEAYWGNRDSNGRWIPGTGWRNGISKPWLGLDLQATPEDSRIYFDLLHGMLWQFYTVVFHEENLKRPTPYPAEKYDLKAEIDDKGDPTGNTISYVAKVKAALLVRKANKPTEFETINQELRRLGFDLII